MKYVYIYIYILLGQDECLVNLDDSLMKAYSFKSLDFIALKCYDIDLAKVVFIEIAGQIYIIINGSLNRSFKICGDVSTQRYTSYVNFNIHINKRQTI